MTRPMQMTSPITMRYDSIPAPLYWKAAQEACKAKTKKPVRHYVWMLAGWISVFLLVGLANQFPVIALNGPAFLAGMVVMWVGLIIFGRLQRRKMNDILHDEQSRRGPVNMSFGPDGCSFNSAFGDTQLNWSAIDQIVDLGNGLGLRSGLMMYPVPDSSLPADMTRSELQKQLKEWAGHD